MDDLIDRLREAAGKPLSGAALARTLGISRAAVHKKILKLRLQGHRISGVNRMGYSLELLSDRPESGSFHPGWGRPFFFFEETGSTQEEAKRRALSGEKEGALFAAERQSAGRGRLGRRWESPAGGLWYSLLLRPSLPPSSVPVLALAAALDWARLLRARGLPAAVKWPNDVWVGGKKVAGILTEMSAEPDRVHWIVLGAGVNVNNAPPKKLPVPAASLQSLTGRAWSRGELLSDWMARFRETYRLCRDSGFAAIREDYRKHSLLTGKAVSVEGPEGRVSGVAADVDEAGRLVVRTARGPVTIVAGDVRVRPAR